MAQIKFADQGTEVSIIKFDTSNIKDNLPQGIWKVAFNPLSGFYLTKQLTEVNIPKQIFGSSKKQLDLITSRFERDNKSMGVLLTGDKGTGKTLLSTLLIKHYQDLGYPVILVDNAYSNVINGMVDFISQISNAVFIFDEFEKVFDTDDQQVLLNFFDDKTNSNRLSIAISNSRSISEFMLSRPSRFFYHFEYKKLDDETIKEVATFNGLNDSVANQLVLVKEKSYFFGFDILLSIIDEIKFRESHNVDAIIETMNIDVSTFSQLKETKLVSFKCLDPNDKSFNDKDLIELSDQDDITRIRVTRITDEDDYDYFDTAYLNASSLLNYDSKTKEYTYRIILNVEGSRNTYMVVVTKKDLEYMYALPSY